MIQTTFTDDIALVDDGEFPKRQPRVGFKEKLEPILVWIWCKKWMWICVLALALNLSMVFTIHKSNKDVANDSNESLQKISSLDFKLSVDDYISIKSSCDALFCTQTLCYCISNVVDDWFSAKRKCQALFNASSLATSIPERAKDALSETQVHKYYYNNIIYSVWIGAYVNGSGASIWLNNQTLDLNGNVPRPAEARHCIVKVNDYYERFSCANAQYRYSNACALCKIRFPKATNASDFNQLSPDFLDYFKPNLDECSYIKCRGTACYCKTYRDFITHKEADRFCKTMFTNSGLTYFENDDEAQFVLKNCPENFMIGATDVHISGKWEWIGGKQGMDFAKVSNFIDNTITNCYYIDLLFQKTPWLYQCLENDYYMCEFPIPSYDNGEIPSNFLYKPMGAPRCKNLSCSETFGTCYCLMTAFAYRWNEGCDSYADWNLLTIKSKGEMQHVENLIRDSKLVWGIGANNFVEKGRFQWIEEGGIDVPLSTKFSDYECVAISSTGFQTTSCKDSLQYICSINRSKMIQGAKKSAYNY